MTVPFSPVGRGKDSPPTAVFDFRLSTLGFSPTRRFAVSHSGGTGGSPVANEPRALNLQICYPSREIHLPTRLETSPHDQPTPHRAARNRENDGDPQAHRRHRCAHGRVLHRGDSNPGDEAGFPRRRSGRSPGSPRAYRPREDHAGTRSSTPSQQVSHRHSGIRTGGIGSAGAGDGREGHHRDR